MLKLENRETNIYINEKMFMQCKYLLLDIPIQKISTFDEIESIDEAAERLDTSMEEGNEIKSEISPETEFWGHCSNLQVWYEHGYNTNLLHSNLAFPLLKKLVDAGDSLAETVFKEEIVKRMKMGYGATFLYLFDEKYHHYLKRVEFIENILNPHDVGILKEIENLLNVEYGLIDSLESLKYGLPDKYVEHFAIKEGFITELELVFRKPYQFPKNIKNLSRLRTLYVHISDMVLIREFKQLLKSIPIDKLHSLELLEVNGGKIEDLTKFIESLIE